MKWHYRPLFHSIMLSGTSFWGKKKPHIFAGFLCRTLISSWTRLELIHVGERFFEGKNPFGRVFAPCHDRFECVEPLQVRRSFAVGEVVSIGYWTIQRISAVSDVVARSYDSSARYLAGQSRHLPESYRSLPCFLTSSHFGFTIPAPTVRSKWHCRLTSWS